MLAQPAVYCVSWHLKAQPSCTCRQSDSLAIISIAGGRSGVAFKCRLDLVVAHESSLSYPCTPTLEGHHKTLQPLCLHVSGFTCESGTFGFLSVGGQLDLERSRVRERHDESMPLEALLAGERILVCACNRQDKILSIMTI